MKIISILAAAFLAVSTLLSSAQEPVTLSGLICDKPEQVVETIQAAIKDEESDDVATNAVNATNEKYGTTVCAMNLTIIGIRGEVVKKFDVKDGEISVVEIVVLGLVNTPQGMMPVRAPFPVYMGFLKAHTGA